MSALVGWVERVYVDSELAKERAQDAAAVLRAIVASDFERDAVSAYEKFVKAIQLSEQQADRLRSSTENMRDAAAPLFERWATDLEGFASTKMRHRSQTRLMETRKLYAAIVAAVDPAQSAYDAFNRDLRDHALFLSHDFNAASVAELQDDVRALTKLVGDLDRKLDVCLFAARAYVDSAALPASPIPGAAPGGAGTGNSPVQSQKDATER